MTDKKKLKAKIRARMAKTGESYQAARRGLIVPSRGAVCIYHVVYEHEGFEESARTLFELVKRAQETAPGKRRVLVLDIDGHRNGAGGFDGDMVELMTDYMSGLLLRYLAEVRTPLYHAKAPTPQNDDIPDTLEIMTPPNEGAHMHSDLGQV